MKKNLYIIGAGGLGREILSTIRNVNFIYNYSIVAFIDNNSGEINGIKIVGNNEYLIKLEKECDVIIAISNTEVRKKVIKQLGDYKHINFITFIHPKAAIYDMQTVQIGKGCFIAEGCVLTTDIKINDFCYLNVGVSIHHDTILGSNCFLMPGVRITGGATIGENTFLGNNIQLATDNAIPANSTIK